MDVTFVALVDSLAVGWLDEVKIDDPDEYGRVMGEAVPVVLPTFRRRGIGKVLYHLGMEEVVRRGARYGWTATGIYNPARLIYRSIGYRYWYTCFSRMSKYLT
jgi:GNAT superfamily N-acetyltransferase